MRQRIVLRIYKECLQLNNKLRKRSGYFTKEKIEMATKHVKRDLIPLIIR